MTSPTRSTGELLSLNKDVLEELVSFLASPDALRLSMTARGLRSIAKRRSLADIRLRSTERATLFCRYMLADIPDRLRWLRRLEIHLGTFYEERISLAIPGLVRVLAHAPSLKSLTFDDAEVMLESGILAAAVRMLTTLEELNLRKYGLLAVSTVRRLCSDLRKLSLTGMLPTRRHVVLTTLLCPPKHSEHITDDDQAAVRWKSIRELELEVACPTHSIPHQAIVDSFPNLIHFQFNVTDVQTNADIPEPALTRAGWPHLDWMGGTPLSLGGFKGPVKCLRLTEERPGILHEHGGAVVKDLDPVMLCVAMPPEPDSQVWKQLVERSHRLRYLRIELSNSGEHAAELDEMRAYVPAALGDLDIVCIGVDITDLQGGVVFSPLVESLALQLAQCIDTLRYVCIRAGAASADYEWHGKITWWRVIGSNEGRQVKNVTTGLGTYVDNYLTSVDFEQTLSLDDALLFPAS
ncbi:uncharacterized protein C8Q71DRAFT_768360 [Rhodofomes roseus]|uniref:F-box domain-containing protein n=1 Tax=Rhodofomes roseus TaxID=34475 RepID=A0ABQ8KCU5_9APHY|nr:uncharacterized protein C8Q71DRAFT_768360 [Rhodofomes roseus]KAH9835029.1 hypothetical protein C8Q71DRAFT_768360 [Rhodofomes roseus]